MIHTPWVTSQQNIMTPTSILQKSPYDLGNSCLFGRFWGIFDIWDTQYQNLGNIIRGVPKVREHVFSNTKSIDLKNNDK